MDKYEVLYVGGESNNKKTQDTWFDSIEDESNQKRESPRTTHICEIYSENMSISQLKWLLDNQVKRGYVKYYAMIEHNIDVWSQEGLDSHINTKIDKVTGKRPINPDTGVPFRPGDRKKPHIHLWLKLKEKKRGSQVAELLDIDPRYVQKPKKSDRFFLAYLTHLNHPEKAQYHDDAVIANFDWIEKRDGKRSPVLNFKRDVLPRIESQEITRNNYYNVLPIDFVVDNEVKIQKAINIVERQHKHDEIIRTMIYVCPKHNALLKSGSGKTLTATEIAKSLANTLNDDYHYMGLGSDYMAGYNGQKVCIMDDRTFNTLPRDTFLNLFDIHKHGIMPSRYEDKDAKWQYLFVTCIKPFEENIKEIPHLSCDEDMTQMRRRFKYILEMDNQSIDLYEYDDELKAHVQRDTFFNTILTNVKDKELKEGRIKKNNDLFFDSFLDTLAIHGQEYADRNAKYTTSGILRLEEKLEKLSYADQKKLLSRIDDIINADYTIKDDPTGAR